MIKKLFLILICICFFTGSVSAASDEIQSLEVEVEVDSGGTCHVKLSIQAEFASTAKEFLVPLGTDAYDINASGAFDTDSRGDVEYAVFENDFGFSGTQSFFCSYSMPCSMTESDDGQYFTLQIPEQGFTLPIAQYRITVRFPVEVTELPTWKSAYYQDVIDNYLNIQVTENVVTASSNLMFKDHETLTMKVRFEPDSFDLNHLPGQTSVLSFIGFALLAILCGLYYFLRLRNKILIMRTPEATSLDSAAGELPCQLYGLAPDLASLLAHWGNLGYVIIGKDRRGRLYIEKTMDMGNERKVAEQRLFRALFGSSDRCEVPSGRFLNAIKWEGELLRRSWVQRMFREDSGNPALLRLMALLAGMFTNLLCFDLLLPARPSRWFWLVVLTGLGMLLCYLFRQVVYAFHRRDGILHLAIGSVAAVVLLILAWNAECTLYMIVSLSLQLFCAYVTRFGGLRSDPGEELLRSILNLRRFLWNANQDVAHQLMATDSQYFYRMLPYAEMMGLGKAFVRRFGAGGNEPCRWLVSEGRKPRTGEEFYTLYCEIMAELRYGQKLTQKRQSLLLELVAGLVERRQRKAQSNRRPERNRPNANRKRSAEARPNANRRRSAEARPDANRRRSAEARPNANRRRSAEARRTPSGARRS